MIDPPTTDLKSSEIQEMESLTLTLRLRTSIVYTVGHQQTIIFFSRLICRFFLDWSINLLVYKKWKILWFSDDWLIYTINCFGSKVLQKG